MTSKRQTRFDRLRERMAEAAVDAVLLSLGADLPWLTGYEAMPLERLTMAVVPADDEATLVVPRLEAPRVVVDPEVFTLRAWSEHEDPVAIVASLVGERARLAISDRTWATFLLALQATLPGATWTPAGKLTGPLRAVKDPDEIEALAAASAAADSVAVELLEGDIPLVGRSEREVSSDISRRLLDAGHHKVNFAIVASGPNAASPHHEPSDRQIQSGEAVVCDFGGTLDGYCSDITRTVWTGTPGALEVEVYKVVQEAQAEAVRAARIGATCEEVDAAARSVIAAAGFGDFYIHRTGHGIGVEEHEDPYIVGGNAERLVAGNAFSVEPGVYLPGGFGVRIEDIVIAERHGARSLNAASHDMVILQK
ncbi:MAG: M24 family metallopeptidase [Acidimicrobiales bacterium]